MGILNNWKAEGSSESGMITPSSGHPLLHFNTVARFHLGLPPNTTFKFAQKSALSLHDDVKDNILKNGLNQLSELEFAWKKLKNVNILKIFWRPVF